MPTYSYTNLKDQIFDSTLDADISSAFTVRDVINRAVRMVNAELDLRSAKRRAVIAQKVFDDIHDYTCPTDLKDTAVIDLIPQANRTLDSRLVLVTQEVFDRKKSIQNNMVALAEDDLIRKLRLSVDSDDDVLTVSTLDSLTAGGGTWALFGDAESVAADTTNLFVEGGGSIVFDISSAGGTTAGIQNTGLDELDLTDYEDDGSAFVWVYINTVADTGSDGLTNFILRIGNDSSNYHAMTVTAINEGAAFTAGWNLLRFDFSGKTTTGTVAPTTVDYVALYMTKETGKADNGYRFDSLTLHTGEYHDILYYSKYPWQTSGGTYIENSTADTDKVNCDTDELDMFTYKGKALAALELRDVNLFQTFETIYQQYKTAYARRNPSERVKKQINYY